MPEIGLETKHFYSFEEVTSGADYRQKVSLPVYDLEVSKLHAGEQSAVAYTYAQGTNRISLGVSCTKIVINTDNPVYLVMDSSDPATDLGDSSVRIYIKDGVPWERVFKDGASTLDFRTLTSGVTAAVRVEAYE